MQRCFKPFIGSSYVSPSGGRVIHNDYYVDYRTGLVDWRHKSEQAFLQEHIQVFLSKNELDFVLDIL